MKHISYHNKKRIKSLIFAAAMVFTLAAQNGGIQMQASAAAADNSSSGDKTNEEGDTYVGADILKDKMGRLELYRWERVTSGNYPQNDKEHMALLFWGKWDDASKDWGRYISVKAPDDIYLGPNANAVDDVSHSFKLSDDGYSWFKGQSDIKEEKTHFLRTQYNALESWGDSQVAPSKNVFFTDTNRYCFNLKYAGTDKKNKTFDGRECPKYTIRLTSTNGVNYYLNATDMDNESLMTVTTNAGSATGFTFQNKSNARGDVFQVFKEDGSGNDDEYLYVRSTMGLIATHDDDEAERDWVKWFQGTKLVFSALKDNTTVEANQLLSVSTSDYVKGNGEEETQNGVMLQNGKKLTIKKGGILCVSGDLINNGTIENMGTIIIKKGGSIYPFLQGNSGGCGAIKNNGGTIIIQQGGTLFAGLNDSSGNVIPFYLDAGSVLINQGTLVYGSMRLGETSRVELYENSKTYGSFFAADIKESFTRQLSQFKSYFENNNPKGANSVLFQTRGDYLKSLQNFLKVLNNSEIGMYLAKDSCASNPKYIEQVSKTTSVQTGRSAHFVKADSAVFNDPNFPNDKMLTEKLSI